MSQSMRKRIYLLLLYFKSLKNILNAIKIIKLDLLNNKQTLNRKFLSLKKIIIYSKSF